MGLYADAELIWGIPVLAHDKDGEPTQFWNEEDEDWRTFDHELKIETYGHYEDPDGPRGILTSERVESMRGSCWTPHLVVLESISDKVLSKANDAARVAELPVDFYMQAEWWLVASYG